MPSLSEPELRRKLWWLTLFRFLTFSVFLGSAFYTKYHAEIPATNPAMIFIYTLGGLTLSLSILYILALLLINRLPFLRIIAYTQLMGDVILSSLMVLITGGSGSPFTLLYGLSIINASILLFNRGVMTTAIASGVAFLVIIAFELGYLSNPFFFIKLAKSRAVYNNLIINFLSFFLIGLLAASLTAQIRRVGLKLEKRELDLEDQRILYENIVESIENGIVTTTLDNIIVACNRRTESILRMSRDKLRLKKIESVLPNLSPYLKKKKMVDRRIEYFIEGENPMMLNVTLSSLFDSHNKEIGCVFVITDITKIMEMEERMRRSEALAVVGKMAAGIAHEIRNPLAAISGSVQLLGRISSPSEDEKRLTNIVIRETENLNHLISDFLDFAKPEKLKPQPFSIHPFLDDIIQIFSKAPEYAIDLQIDLQGDKETVVNADALQLKRAIWNLLVNGAQAMNGTGRISIRYSMEDVNGFPFLVICIADNGPGIPLENKDRIFEPFFTTKEGGTGLGLPIAVRIIENHKGWLDLDSIPGEGTTAEIFLPMES